MILLEDENVTDKTGQVASLSKLGEKEYLEVLKNLLEVPKFLVSLIFFLTTVTAALARLKHDLGSFERLLFSAGLVASLLAAMLGYRVVAHVLAEMAYGTSAEDRPGRFLTLRTGVYSSFVKMAMVPIVLWMLCLFTVIAAEAGAPTTGAVAGPTSSSPAVWRPASP